MIAPALVAAAVALAAPHGGAPEKTKDGVPVYDVPVRRESTPWCLPKKAASQPYAADLPEPFVYKADSEKNETCAFVVGGTNSDECLAKTKTITGVDLKILERRLRPNRTKGSDAGSSLKPRDAEAWKGVNNFSQRVSTAGFLDYDQDLRELLRKDNQTVLDKKLTHQKVAAPVLRLVEKLRKAGKPKIEDGDFVVERKHMAGGVLRPLERPKADKEEDEEGRCDSGWIGAGVQGSPFDDELYANHVLVITNTKTKATLTIDELTPHLIYRYGFYQGGEYRVAPEKLVAFFGTK